MYSKHIKRLIDFILALSGIILIFSVLILVIILLQFSGEGEVFYRQERLGYRKRLFGMLKFATMLKNSPNMGSKTITVRDDPRITHLGKYLRITKINELPQIFNVLVGDMSLVGPRPLLATSFAKYADDVQQIIYQNRPGITGIGSLVFRDEEKLVSAYNALGLDPMDYYKKYIYPYKGELEKWYYHHVSFLTDIKILFLTFWSLVSTNSQLVYKIFPSLPPKPKELSVEWINQQKKVG